MFVIYKEIVKNRHIMKDYEIKQLIQQLYDESNNNQQAGINMSKFFRFIDSHDIDELYDISENIIMRQVNSIYVNNLQSLKSDLDDATKAQNIYSTPKQEIRQYKSNLYHIKNAQVNSHLKYIALTQVQQRVYQVVQLYTQLHYASKYLNHSKSAPNLVFKRYYLNKFQQIIQTLGLNSFKQQIRQIDDSSQDQQLVNEVQSQIAQNISLSQYIYTLKYCFGKYKFAESIIAAVQQYLEQENQLFKQIQNEQLQEPDVIDYLFKLIKVITLISAEVQFIPFCEQKIAESPSQDLLTQIYNEQQFSNQDIPEESQINSPDVDDPLIHNNTLYIQPLLKYQLVTSEKIIVFKQINASKQIIQQLVDKSQELIKTISQALKQAIQQIQNTFYNNIPSLHRQILFISKIQTQIYYLYSYVLDKINSQPEILFDSTVCINYYTVSKQIISNVNEMNNDINTLLLKCITKSSNYQIQTLCDLTNHVCNKHFIGHQDYDLQNEQRKQNQTISHSTTDFVLAKYLGTFNHKSDVTFMWELVCVHDAIKRSSGILNNQNALMLELSYIYEEPLDTYNIILSDSTFCPIIQPQIELNDDSTLIARYHQFFSLLNNFLRFSSWYKHTYVFDRLINVLSDQLINEYTQIQQPARNSEHLVNNDCIFVQNLALLEEHLIIIKLCNKIANFYIKSKSPLLDTENIQEDAINSPQTLFYQQLYQMQIDKPEICEFELKQDCYTILLKQHITFAQMFKKINIQKLADGLDYLQAILSKFKEAKAALTPRIIMQMQQQLLAEYQIRSITFENVGIYLQEIENIRNLVEEKFKISALQCVNDYILLPVASAFQFKTFYDKYWNYLGRSYTIQQLNKIISKVLNKDEIPEIKQIIQNIQTQE